MLRESLRGIALGCAIAACACSGGATGPSIDPHSADSGLPVVLSVTPASNAVNADPSSPITVAFSHPMMVGTELLVMLHEASILGPQVTGTSSSSSDRRILTFVPATRLQSKTTYVLHLSPNLRDAAGQGINFAGCAQSVGGQAPSGGWTMGGMMGSGSGMMGPGWQPAAGTWGYGMIFAFTTA